MFEVDDDRAGVLVELGSLFLHADLVELNLEAPRTPLRFSGRGRLGQLI